MRPTPNPCPGTTVSDRSTADLPRSAGERRRLARQAVRRPLILVPVLPHGGPDWEGRIHGATVDASRSGVRLVLDRAAPPEVCEVVLALPTASGTVRCAGLEIRRRNDAAPGTFELGVEVGGFADQIFRAENLTPTWRPEQCGFGLGLPDVLLEAWSAVGLLQPRTFDRLLVCPRCRALPTYRRGCANCGSAVGLAQDLLLHHFACAHVGAPEEFQRGEELRCPKCRTRRLVIGADYEQLPGLYRCRDCHWSADEAESVAECMGCRLRFPADQALEIELKGYHAERLDPLALATAS